MDFALGAFWFVVGWVLVAVGYLIVLPLAVMLAVAISPFAFIYRCSQRLCH